jgi:hypothetical protein
MFSHVCFNRLDDVLVEAKGARYKCGTSFAILVEPKAKAIKLLFLLKKSLKVCLIIIKIKLRILKKLFYIIHNNK